jgi:hypothetical protein
MQAWRRCFTAPSWEHVLVLVMGALLAPGKRYFLPAHDRPG